MYHQHLEFWLPYYAVLRRANCCMSLYSRNPNEVFIIVVDRYVAFFIFIIIIYILLYGKEVGLFGVAGASGRIAEFDVHTPQPRSARKVELIHNAATGVLIYLMWKLALYSFSSGQQAAGKGFY
jgi:hypothetical protein